MYIIIDFYEISIYIMMVYIYQQVFFNIRKIIVKYLNFQIPHKEIIEETELQSINQHDKLYGECLSKLSIGGYIFYLLSFNCLKYNFGDVCIAISNWQKP
jgi:hypothetical protein